jgi:RecB family exonuclease
MDFVFNPTRDLDAMQTDPQGGLVKSWSYSALKDFEECQYRIFLKRVDKREGKKNDKANRGTEIHALAEAYVKGEGPLDPTLANFEHELTRLAELYKAGKVQVEEDWAFDVDWQPTGWFADNVWGRFKLDAYVQEDETSARVIDYKTGKKFGNEINHGGQAILYAVATFMRHPGLQFIQAEFYYLDLKTDNTLVKTFTRPHAMVFMPKLHERAVKLTSAREFKPKPSKMTCKWCEFRETCEWKE